MTKDEALKLALEALEHWMQIDTVEDMHIFETVIAPEAITALRQALEQPEPNIGLIPSEWAGLKKSDIPIDRGAWSDVPDATKWVDELRGDNEHPEREWQGLTDEDIAEGARQSWVDRQAFESAVWWAEAKLRDKNGF